MPAGNLLIGMDLSGGDLGCDRAACKKSLALQQSGSVASIGFTEAPARQGTCVAPLPPWKETTSLEGA